MTKKHHNNPISRSAAEAHAAINANHGQSRVRLLDCLPNTPSGYAPKVLLTSWQFMFGGIGLGATVSAVMLVVWLLGTATPAVALERLAQAIEKVNAYSYRMDQVYVSQKGEGRTVRQVTVGRWRTEPVGLHATTRIVETQDTNTLTPGEPKTLADIEESHQAGQFGILVDHLAKEYWSMNEVIDAAAIPPGSPQVIVHMVQQRRGRVLRDLGQKQINGKKTRGLEIILDQDQPVSELGVTTSDEEPGRDWRNAKIEVWVDPKTDLPIEFRHVRRGDDFETTYRFTDLQWNRDFAEDAFKVDVPQDYTKLDKSDVDEGPTEP